MVTLLSKKPTVVTLKPPIISHKTISEKIICTRPMRKERFNISLEHKNSKTIINCYGHGGSGWTTLFGSINKALGLFQNEKNLKKDRPICIIGSGCMGLTAAIELAHLGFRVDKIVTKEKLNIPSWIAAGYFAMVSLDTSPEEEENVNAIGLDTFQIYQQIEKGQHPYITKEAVRFLPVFGHRELTSGIENLVERGMVPPGEAVTLDFDGVQHQDFTKFMSYFMNTSLIMQQLTAEIKRLRIPIEMREVESFNEIDESIIFNCSGLGAKKLNQDSQLIPIRGHIITLNEDAGSGHIDYMLYSKVEQEGNDESIYLFPKNLSITAEYPEGRACRGILGGTFIPEDSSLSPEKQQQLDQLEFDKMIRRHSRFFYRF